ncbi:hypothetical protein M9H77_16833 [Catharanthus roseus]|uniref:Uncharacterized protein n=1 Tax=Catharanthus roseus TaxID=4058 RepID=A0ACC0B2U7_CATRO|nr:hypothetical protein M9H77_16833 [Catharanthus roseus]
MAFVMRKFKIFYKKGFNNRGKKPPFKKGGQSSSLFKARIPDRFISVKEAANFEEWTRNRRKIAPGHRVDLNDVQGMQAVPNLFEMIGWTSLLTVNELYYVEMIYEFYANLHKGRIERVDNIPHQWVLTRIGGREIAFDDTRRMNFGYMAIEHMLAIQSSSTKCLPYGCFITKILQHFIYNQQTFKRMGFEKNEEGAFIQGGQEEGDDDDKEDDDEDQEGMNVEEEASEEETETEIQRRETRQKKRQERIEEGLSLGSVSQLMEMIASLQTSMNTRFDAFDGHFEVLDGKVSDIQERLIRLEARDRDEGH